MFLRKAKFFILLLVATVLTLASCSPKKNTFVRRQYHYVTARFNVGFNAKESYKAGVRKTNAIEPEAYDELLPVFSFNYPNAGNVVSADMDRVSEKITKMVAEHSITAKPKVNKGSMSATQREFYNKREFNEMIDDGYLILGKSTLYTNDFSKSVEVFEFMKNEYPKANTIHEAKLWEAIAFAQNEDIQRAEEVLKELEKDPKLPKNLTPTLNAAWADVHIKKEEYKEAIPRLETALKRAGNKATKIRYNFILAQLNTLVGNKTQALAYYDKVIKKNPPYAFRFNAQMNKALSYDPSTNKKDLRIAFEKALKDKKNEEYQGQIYYALGNIEKADGNIKGALDYYRQSVATSDYNQRQKGLSYLAIADIAYDSKDYYNAYFYYDSTANALGKDYSRYDEIAKKAASLQTLARSLQIIKLEDSLQYLAKLPPAERDKMIDGFVAAATAKETAQAEQLKKQQEYIFYTDMNNSMRPNQSSSTEGKWYFYNVTALNQGAADFKMRWGNRKLEDNWRRRVKGVVDIAEASDTEVIDEIESVAELSQQKDHNFYLQRIPLTDSALIASNNRIQSAMFRVGEAYANDLNESEEAIKAFESLNTRFSQGRYLLNSYYYLYNLYTQAGNLSQAEYYKSAMVRQFPNEPFTLAVTNPNYQKELEEAERAIERYYEVTLNSYNAGRNDEVVQRVNEAMRLYPKSSILPNFEFLKVLATNYNGNVELYKQGLNSIIKKYPDNSVAKEAQSMLNIIQAQEVSLANSAGQPDAPQIDTETQSVTNYVLGTGEHYVLIVVENKESITDLQFALENFNADNYLNESLETNVQPMGNYKIIIIQKFSSKDKAMGYYNKLAESPEVFASIDQNSFSCFAITPENLDLLTKNSAILDYIIFFNTNYLNP